MMTRYGYYDQAGKLQIVNYHADPHKGFPLLIIFSVFFIGWFLMYDNVPLLCLDVLKS